MIFLKGNAKLQRQLLSLMYCMPPDVFIEFVYTYLAQSTQLDFDTIVAGLKINGIGLVITPDNDIFINKEE